MKAEQILLVLIMAVVLVLGFMGIVWIVYGNAAPCPSGSIYKSGVCCQDFNNDGRCDVAVSQASAPTGMTIQVESGPTENEVLVTKLDAALKALETQQNMVGKDGYYCDDFGCRRYSSNHYQSSYYTDRDYYDDRYYDDRYYDDRYYDDRYYDDRYYGNDEWDLRVIVKDDDSRDSIEDARVKIEGDDDETEYTDDDGEVKFRDIKEDCYDIKVRADDYYSEDDYTCVTRDKTIRIYLRPRD